MSEKLAERLQAALLTAYWEAQDQSLTSAKLSEAQRLIEDQIKPMEEALAQAQADVEALREVQRAAQAHINAVRYQIEIEDEPHTHRVLSEKLAALPEHLRGSR